MADHRLKPLQGDGLPTLETGEPVLARWFVILMLLLVPAGFAITIWALSRADQDPLPPAERRPPGTAEVTHERGDARLSRTTETSPGPSCAAEIDVLGDEAAQATGRRALGAACQLLLNGDYPDAEAGLEAWAANDGLLRIAVFELTGVDSSARVEAGRVVIELNAKFQFEDATRAAPVILHELVHLGRGWPGQAVTARDELEAMVVQARACDTLVFRQQPPRACLDATQLLEEAEVLARLEEAGFPSDVEADDGAGDDG